MTRHPLLVANWKMNPPPENWDAIDSPYRSTDAVDVLVLPPYLYLKTCLSAGLRTGAQCGHPEPIGAHTGCVSIAMVATVGCETVLCGHSDRRREQGETDAFVAEQVRAAFDAHLLPIACIGESEQERSAGKMKEVIQKQLQAVVYTLPTTHYQLVIAYEPVWAIGTGTSAAPQQVQDMHAFIRSLLPQQIQASTLILYGGSLQPDNAADIFAQPDIDGGLVGASSLRPHDFRKLVATVEESARA